MPSIRSDPDPESSRPWFDFDVDPDAMTVTFQEANGLENFPDAADAADLSHLPPNSAHAVSTSADYPEEVHHLLVELDGTLSFVPASQRAGVYYACIAYYDPGADTWDVFDFVDAGGELP